VNREYLIGPINVACFHSKIAIIKCTRRLLISRSSAIAEIARVVINTYILSHTVFKLLQIIGQICAFDVRYVSFIDVKKRFFTIF